MNREKRDFLPKKQANSRTVNYLAFIAGMVTTLMATLMIWSYLSSPSNFVQTTSATVKLPKSPTKQFPLRISEEGLDAGLQSASADQLEERLVRINEWDRQAALTVRLSQNQDRVSVADRLLQLPISERQRNLAIKSKVDALSALYGLDFLFKLKSPNVGATLRDVANTYQDDANEALALKCKLALLKVDVFESIKNKKLSEIPPIVDRSTTLLKNYPDDEFVLSNIDLIIKSLAGYDQNAGTELMREMISRADEFKSPFMQRFFQSLTDQVKLYETDYQKLFENRWINGEAGRQELFETTRQLATDPEGGNLVLSHIGTVVNWLEQDDNYDQCQQIFQALLDSADNREVEATRLAARKYAEHGLTRSNLVGKKLEFNGKLISGDSLDRSVLKNRVVIVLFWSAKQPESFSQISRFHANCKDLIARGVRVLAVCTDDEIDESLALRSKRIPNFQIVTNRVGNQVENWIGEQCPVDKIPHAMIVNRYGMVADVNVPFDELKSKAEFLTTQRYDRSSDDRSSVDPSSVDPSSVDPSTEDQAAGDQ